MPVYGPQDILIIAIVGLSGLVMVTLADGDKEIHKSVKAPRAWASVVWQNSYIRIRHTIYFTTTQGGAGPPWGCLLDENILARIHSGPL